MKIFGKKFVNKFKKLFSKVENIPTKKLLIPFYFSLLFFLLSTGLYLYLTFGNIFVKSESPEITLEESSPLNLPADDPTVNVLFLGMGGAGHDGGTLADSIVLARIDTENKKAALISIPRDLWVPIPVNGDSTVMNKINMAYAIGVDDKRYTNKKEEFKGEAGGGNISKDIVSYITGLKVDKFVAVDFVGFQRVVGTLGGIEVDVPKTFNDYFYPIKGKELDLCGMSPEKINEIHQKYSGFELEKQFECRYEHIHFDKGLTEMEGEDALKFVRSRHGDNDYGRNERQLAVLEGIKNKVVSLDIVKKGGKILDQLSSNVRTDIGMDEIKALADLAGNPNEYEIIRVQLNEDNTLSASNAQGQFILVPKEGNNKWKSIQDYILNSFNFNEE